MKNSVLVVSVSIKIVAYEFTYGLGVLIPISAHQSTFQITKHYNSA